MLRINDLKLPLDHDDEALRATVLARLSVRDHALLEIRVFLREVDSGRLRQPGQFAQAIGLMLQPSHAAATFGKGCGGGSFVTD